MTQPVPPPPNGLGGYSNYFLYSDCNPVLDLSVTIDVTEEIVCKSATYPPPPGSSAPDGPPGPKGFSFQLNVSSLVNDIYPKIIFQQYVIILLADELFGVAQGWPLSPGPDPVYNSSPNNWDLVSVPESATLPAGYQLQISLQNALPWRTSWDLAVTGAWGGGSGLLLYDRAAGLGAFYTVDGNGVWQTLAQYDNWRTSWDLAVTGDWGDGASGLLLYDQAAGYAATYTVDSNGGLSDPLAHYDNWRTSWDLAVTGGQGAGDSWLLLYDRAAGYAEFHRVDSNGVTMDPLNTYHNFRTSWDLAVTGGWGAGDSGLLLYDRAAGFAAFSTVDGKGRVNPLQQSDGSVIAAAYTVTDNHGRVHTSGWKDLYSIPGVTAADLAPIGALELDIVGPWNGETAVLSSGAGTITYTASTPLTVLNGYPPCWVYGYIGEQANTVYGQLPGLPGNTFTQSFSVTEAPMIRKPSTLPGLIIAPPTT
jgi:hypothetical protein